MRALRVRVECTLRLVCNVWGARSSYRCAHDAILSARFSTVASRSWLVLVGFKDLLRELLHQLLHAHHRVLPACGYLGNDSLSVGGLPPSSP